MRSKFVTDKDLAILQRGPAVIRNIINAMEPPMTTYTAPLVGMRFHPPATAMQQNHIVSRLERGDLAR